MKNEFGKKFEMVCDILDRHQRNSSNLIAILQEIQEAYSYLPEDIMTYVATALEVSPGIVFGVATFYSHFTLDPKGKYVIKVCDGTACHVKKSLAIINMLEKELKLNEKKKTSDDLLFTLETVNCLGACGIAPVVVINEDVYGSMNPEKTKALIDKIRKEESANA
ncbi:NADH-quinone oxidoreductase subunit NuoE family protein [Treponema sp. R80B11-R83G3]